MKRRRYALVTLKVMDDGREYTLRCLLTTLCRNIDFAAQYLAAHFWDGSWLEDGAWYSHGGGVATTVDDYKEVSESGYKYLHELFYN